MIQAHQPVRLGIPDSLCYYLNPPPTSHVMSTHTALLMVSQMHDCFMPECGNTPYLSFLDPFLYSLLIIQDPIQVLIPLRELSWAPAAFIPKLEPHFNSVIPQQDFPAFTITILLSIYLLMCLSHIKGKDRACFTLICPISRISSVTEQTINWTDLNCTETPLWPPQ